jgi:release factor glutamine methyltransferase
MKEEMEHRDHTPAPAPEQGRREGGMPTIATVRRAIAARLAAAGIEQPALDARILVGHALDLSRDQMLTGSDRPVTAKAGARLEAMVARRLAREPVSRILGQREFWSLRFDLAPETLDPRPDSETVVEAALAATGADALAVLDLGTGSGCLLLALLSERPGATGLGIDASPGAIAAAMANAARLGLAPRARFERHDWRSGLDGRLTPPRFDVILANPPYIPDGEVARLEPEVSRFDPLAALAGGPDGLDAYRQLAPQLADLLTANGVAVFEVGAGQAAAVAGLFTAAGLEIIGIRADLGGIDRCVVARTRR